MEPKTSLSYTMPTVDEQSIALRVKGLPMSNSPCCHFTYRGVRTCVGSSDHFSSMMKKTITGAMYSFDMERQQDDNLGSRYVETGYILMYKTHPAHKTSGPFNEFAPMNCGCSSPVWHGSVSTTWGKHTMLRSF